MELSAQLLLPLTFPSPHKPTPRTDVVWLLYCGLLFLQSSWSTQRRPTVATGALDLPFCLGVGVARWASLTRNYWKVRWMHPAKRSSFCQVLRHVGIASFHGSIHTQTSPSWHRRVLSCPTVSVVLTHKERYQALLGHCPSIAVPLATSFCLASTPWPEPSWHPIPGLPDKNHYHQQNKEDYRVLLSRNRAAAAAAAVGAGTVTATTPMCLCVIVSCLARSAPMTTYRRRRSLSTTISTSLFVLGGILFTTSHRRTLANPLTTVTSTKNPMVLQQLLWVSEAADHYNSSPTRTTRVVG